MGRLLARLPLIGRYFARRANPTADDVRDFWIASHAHWGTSRINKADSREMKMVAEALNAMSIIDRKTFLEQFTTTIGTRIYTPFEPGVPTPDWPLWDQIKICSHEHVHTQQDRAAGGLGFEWNYLTSAAHRAHYEAEAYRGDMALEYRYQGRTMSARRTAELLLYYGCSLADVEVVEKMLGLSMVSIKQGVIPDMVTSWSVEWLDARWGWR